MREKETKGEAGDTVSLKHCQRQREGRWCAVGASWCDSRLRVCVGYVRVALYECNSGLVRREGQRSLADVPQSVPRWRETQRRPPCVLQAEVTSPRSCLLTHNNRDRDDPVSLCCSAPHSRVASRQRERLLRLS